MSKLIGYIVMLIGVVVIGARLLFKNIIKIPYLGNTKISSVIGIVLIIIGFFLTKPSSSKTPKQLPIYDKTGKKIIGYRESR